MSAPHTTRDRPGAASIVHPGFIRDRLAPLFSSEASTAAAGIPTEHHDSQPFDRVRTGARSAVPAVGTRHPGAKGRFVFRVKRGVARAIYWYVDPVVGRLRESILESVDVTESVAVDAEKCRSEAAALRCQVDALRREVESLRRDLDRDVATRRPVEPPAGIA